MNTEKMKKVFFAVKKGNKIVNFAMLTNNDSPEAFGIMLLDAIKKSPKLISSSFDEWNKHYRDNNLSIQDAIVINPSNSVNNKAFFKTITKCLASKKFIIEKNAMLNQSPDNWTYLVDLDTNYLEIHKADNDKEDENGKYASLWIAVKSGDKINYKRGPREIIAVPILSHRLISYEQNKEKAKNVFSFISQYSHRLSTSRKYCFKNNNPSLMYLEDDVFSYSKVFSGDYTVIEKLSKELREKDKNLLQRLNERWEGRTRYIPEFDGTFNFWYNVSGTLTKYLVNIVLSPFIFFPKLFNKKNNTKVKIYPLTDKMIKTIKNLNKYYAENQDTEVAKVQSKKQDESNENTNGNIYKDNYRINNENPVLSMFHNHNNKTDKGNDTNNLNMNRNNKTDKKNDKNNFNMNR